jgi:Xaa-Pro aminopeptidase
VKAGQYSSGTAASRGGHVPFSGMATDVLIYASTVLSAELRHEIPISVPDAFLYGEHGGQAFAVVNALDGPGIRAARPDLTVLDPFVLGLVELLDDGEPRDDALDETALRGCREIGLTAARVPRTFPVALADRMRAAGIELTVDHALFDGRRRVKGGAELEGIRRASVAAVAGMRAAAALLARADTSGELLHVDGEVLTMEALQAEIRAAVGRHDARLDDLIAAAGPQGAAGHAAGSGPIPTGSPVVVDLWPQDRVSTCWADMTRTFVAGTPSDEVIAWHNRARDALARTVDVLAPGITGKALWEVACDVLEAGGEPTQRSHEGYDTPLRDGFFYSLGHGVGLEVHEAPALGRSGGEDVIVAGDVLALEPGSGRHDVGAARVEDLYLVTEDGAELLTPFPHDLDPAVGAVG